MVSNLPIACVSKFVNNGRRDVPKRIYATMRDRIIANSFESPNHSWDNVPCWDWAGSVFPHRCRGLDVPQPREECYGRIGIRFKRGPRKGQVKSTGAHRESAKAFKPWLKVGTKNIVRHCCNRPICVNPHHLTGSEQRVNIRQAVKEGRHKTPFRRSNGERYTAKRAT